MADSGKRKHEDLSDTGAEARRARRESPPESQESDPTLESAAEDESNEADGFKTILATLPPLQQWSIDTIRGLKSAVNDRYPEIQWKEDSGWTRRVIDAILDSNEGGNWRRLKTCSNTEYFSLPTHTITLLNHFFHVNALDEANVRCEAGHYSSPLDLSPAAGGSIGYPIFRMDYTNDEEFELYKTCWERFLEKEFYVPEAVDQDDITWYWVDDKAKLDGKGPREARQLFQRLCATTLPHGLKFLRVCLMVDHEAIESMLRVYGPPATEVFQLIPSRPRKKEIPFLPYITAVGTSWTEKNSDEEGGDKESGGQSVDDGEYHGHFKCALRSIFKLWQNEEIQSPEEYYPRDGSIWGDNGYVYEAPSSL